MGNEGDGFPLASLRGQALCGNNRWGWGGPEPPLRVINNEGLSSVGAIYFHGNHGRGRPRGPPLRGMGSVGGEGTGEGWVPASARTTEGEGSVEEASSAVGFVEGNRRHYCQTASRMPMTA